jgi:hypothetical protein
MSTTPMPSREEFKKIYEQGEEAVFAFILPLALRKEALEQGLRMVSDPNRSRPPSSDGSAKPGPKPKNFRKKMGKK